MFWAKLHKTSQIVLHFKDKSQKNEVFFKKGFLLGYFSYLRLKINKTDVRV